MTQIEGLNPFRPGDGQRPPYLAGRESEQGRLRKILAEISAGRPPAANMVMYGPRGMGKTVLLNWLVDEVEKTAKHNRPLRTVQSTPTIFPSLKSLWNKLISDDWKEKLWPNQIELGAGGNKIVWNSKAPDDDDLVSALIEECKERPVVLLMDEAHTMEPAFCQALLNISQQARQNAPFLLVLAGTPGLRHFLSTVNASFIERSNVIGIARLDAQATADAIVKPLNEHGIEIDADDLERVVEDSQHYPYFIQLWGESLWDLAKQKELQKLTSEEITEAETKVENRRSNFYEQRRATLDDLELLPAAVAIAAVFQNTETTTRDRLKEIIADNLPADSLATQSVNEHLQTLIRHEFIWNPPDSILFEAGIPSLMRYVLDRQREHVQKVSPASLA
ncbi:AAA family ATPase [Candidatus Spongiihabitans sp.]|uniref:AAA family ATPase n=1 Tax=Candidatus Spongiihabitans sp. TaxID=3101308 RepID=UPI003C7E4AEB